MAEKTGIAHIHAPKGRYIGQVYAGDFLTRVLNRLNECLEGGAQS